MRSALSIMFGVAAVALVAAPLTSYAGGTISGKVTFAGKAEQKEFLFSKFPNPKFCPKIANKSLVDGDKRFLKQIEVGKDGGLKGAVVAVADIEDKAWMDGYAGTEVVAAFCDFQPFSGVVVNNRPFKVENTDADPDDPKSVAGVLHNPPQFHGEGRILGNRFQRWSCEEGRQTGLMANCEVYLGLRSMEKLERDVSRDRNASNVYGIAAKKVKNGIQNELYNDAVSLYRYAKFEDGTYAEANLNVWYPGTTHLAWPHLFEVIEPQGRRAQIQMSKLNNSWDGNPNPNWATGVIDKSGFTWPSIGYAALLAGDRARAQVHANLVVNIKLPYFPYPITVDEAGWLLRTLVILSSR